MSVLSATEMSCSRHVPRRSALQTACIVVVCIVSRPKQYTISRFRNIGQVSLLGLSWTYILCMVNKNFGIIAVTACYTETKDNFLLSCFVNISTTNKNFYKKIYAAISHSFLHIIAKLCEIITAFDCVMSIWIEAVNLADELVILLIFVNNQHFANFI